MVLFQSLAFRSYESHIQRRSVDQAKAVVGFQWAIVSVAVLVVLCRIYIRCLRKRNPGLDDACIVVATGLSIFGAVAAMIAVDNGFGKHIWEIPKRQLPYAIKWLVIAVFQNYIGLFFVRLSIGIFILRMLAKVEAKLRFTVWCAIFLDFAVTVMIICLATLWCRPIQGIWDKSIHASCISNAVLDHANKAFAGISAANDVLYACLPVAVFSRLNMDLKTKINLVIIMSLTLLICACAIGRAANVDELNPDFTYVNLPGTYWAVAEDNLGIIVASLPALRQFYFVTREDFTSLKSKFNSNRSYKSRRTGSDSEALHDHSHVHANKAWQALNDSRPNDIELAKY